MKLTKEANKYSSIFTTVQGSSADCNNNKKFLIFHFLSVYFLYVIRKDRNP